MGMKTLAQSSSLTSMNNPENESFSEFSEALADKGFVTTQLDKVVNWART